MKNDIKFQLENYARHYYGKTGHIGVIEECDNITIYVDHGSENGKAYEIIATKTDYRNIADALDSCPHKVSPPTPMTKSLMWFIVNNMKYRVVACNNVVFAQDHRDTNEIYQIKEYFDFKY